MSSALSALRSGLARLERGIDRLKVSVKSRFDLFRPLHIDVYRGHGTPERLFVRGRVLEETGTAPVRGEAGRIRNVLNTLHRMESDEVPGARLRLSAAGAETDVETDREGYFSAELRPATSLDPGWHEVRAELLDSPARQTGVRATGEILVPAPDSEFGVVSDLDDTVVQTGARNKLTHARILFQRNALSHVPFPGIDEFYRQLRVGPDGRGANPVFYVSRSAWNLYDLFVEFLDAHGMPEGPLHMQDAAIVEPRSEQLGKRHTKVESIGHILDAHPGLSLVLVGDSGQDDPEIYREVALSHPDRIRAVYVRDVTPPERDREVDAIIRELETAGVPMCAEADTPALARHAERMGLIPQGGAARVERAARERRASQDAG